MTASLSYWLKISWDVTQGNGNNHSLDEAYTASRMYQWVTDHCNSLQLLAIYWELAYYKFAPGLTHTERINGTWSIILESHQFTNVAGAKLWVLSHNFINELSDHRA
jgi:hypothetical protein